MFSLRKLRCALIAAYTFLTGGSRGEDAELYSLVSSDTTRGNGMKLCHGKFILDRRKRLFTKGVIGHWNRLLREGVMEPSLSEVKEDLDDAFSYMV